MANTNGTKIPPRPMAPGTPRATPVVAAPAGGPRPMAGAPAAPPSMASMQQKMTDRLTKAGYQGPMPGTQALKDARAAGQTPIRDFRQANAPARPGLGRPQLGAPLQRPAVLPRPGASFPRPPNGNTGIVPPHMLAEGGKAKRGKAPVKPAVKPGFKAPPKKPMAPHKGKSRR